MRKNERNLDNCLKCTYCNTVCPVLKANPIYPGPKRLGPELERFRKSGVDSVTDWVDYCLGCGQCNLVCPNGVQVAELIAGAKFNHHKRGKRMMRDSLLARPGLLGRLGTLVPPVTNAVLGLRLTSHLMSGTMDISENRKFPPYAAKRLSSSPGVAEGKERLLFFPGCFAQHNKPGVGDAAIKVLELFGYCVEVARTGCCGLPAMANGNAKEMQARARHNILSLEKAIGGGHKIVVACTSCGHTLKCHYPHLFEQDKHLDELAQQVAANTFDLGEFLLGLESQGESGRRPGNVELSLAYHAPCHLKAQGIGKPWLSLLARIPGLRVVDVNAGCCGIAGTYGFKKEKYQLSMDIGRDLFDGLKKIKPDVVVSECATCQMQIQDGTGFAAAHPVEILYRAFNQTAF